MSYLEKLKRLEQAKAKPEIAEARDPSEGDILAVLIDSPIVGPVWFAFSDDFKPGEGLAVFYGHELEFLKTKTPEQLRKIHALKLGAVGLGTKVRQ